MAFASVLVLLGPAVVASAAGTQVSPTTTLAPGQTGPAVTGDDLVVPGSAPLGIDVLQNDSGGSTPIDPATLAVVVPPKHGTAKVEDDHTLTYQFDHGYAGDDLFEYQVCDQDGACSQASVLVTHDGSEPYVAAGYLLVAAVIAGYAFHTLRRGRKLSPQVPEESRRWM